MPGLGIEHHTLHSTSFHSVWQEVEVSQIWRGLDLDTSVRCDLGSDI